MRPAAGHAPGQAAVSVGVGAVIRAPRPAALYLRKNVDSGLAAVKVDGQVFLGGHAGLHLHAAAVGNGQVTEGDDPRPVL